MQGNLSTNEALSIVRKYKCSRCYGPLMAIADPLNKRFMAVTCTNSACNGAGFVTQHYVDRRKSEDKGDMWEAKKNLAAILPKDAPMTEDEIMSQLGWRKAWL